MEDSGLGGSPIMKDLGVMLEHKLLKSLMCFADLGCIKGSIACKREAYLVHIEDCGPEPTQKL